MFHILQLHSRLFLLSVFAMVVAPGAFADTVVIPNAQTSVEGGESNTLPFGRTLFSNDPYRYQQVYNASGFGEQAAPITIDEIRFRPDSNNFFATTMTVGSIEVRLSTTQAAADGLDNDIFDNNIGSNPTLVYSGGLVWPIPTVTAAPRPFELAIPLATSFEYDPSGGNLLLEIYNLSVNFPLDYILDTENTIDEVSRAIDNIVPGTCQVNMPRTCETCTCEIATTLQNQSRGLVTQFVYTVPESSAVASGVGALVALAALRRTRTA